MAGLAIVKRAFYSSKLGALSFEYGGFMSGGGFFFQLPIEYILVIGNRLYVAILQRRHNA